MKTLFATFIAASFCIVAHAAPLTWQECVTEAIAHNPDVAAANEATRAAEFSLSASYGGFLPQLSANGTFNHGNSGTVSGGAVVAAGATTRDTVSVGLSATEQLFSGGRDIAKVKEARANLETSLAQLSIAKAKLSYDLKNGFAQLLFAQDSIRLSETIVKRREGNLRLVNLRFEGGRENKGSYLLSKASLAQAGLDLDSARRNVALSRRLLARVLGRPSEEDLAVQGEFAVTTSDESPDFKALAQKTPEYRQAESQLVLAQAQTDESRAAFFPELSLNASASRQGDHVFPDTNRWSVGMQLSFPFFPGGANIFNYAAASVSERKSELIKRATEDQLVVKLQSAYVDLENSVGQHKVAEEFLAAAEERATIARGKYTTGLMTFEDWDLIENDLISRERAALTTRRDAYLSVAAWEQTQGKGAIQ